MSFQTACDDLVSEFRARTTPRAGSLITTVFGDSIAPRGGTVWLGSLIQVMSDFGINERLVRTSVYRLAKDGWLQARQLGRRAFYSLTDEGRERFATATHRIYGSPVTEWDGHWCLLLLSGLAADSKEVVRRECGWIGFGVLSPNVLAHPSPDMTDLDLVLRRLHVDDDVVVMSGRTVRSESAMRALARSSWNLDEIDDRYEAFVTRFRPLIAAMSRSESIAPRTAFIARTLLVQEYRKVLLRDPQLPAELLPAAWHGTAAQQLCRNLYRSLYTQTDEYLSQVMETADGPLPPPAAGYLQRFGGLEGDATPGRKSA